jgi:hypothetical protein
VPKHCPQGGSEIRALAANVNSNVEHRRLLLAAMNRLDPAAAGVATHQEGSLEPPQPLGYLDDGEQLLLIVEWAEVDPYSAVEETGPIVARDAADEMQVAAAVVPMLVVVLVRTYDADLDLVVRRYQAALGLSLQALALRAALLFADRPPLVDQVGEDASSTRFAPLAFLPLVHPTIPAPSFVTLQTLMLVALHRLVLVQLHEFVLVAPHPLIFVGSRGLMLVALKRHGRLGRSWSFEVRGDTTRALASRFVVVTVAAADRIAAMIFLDLVQVAPLFAVLHAGAMS